MALSSSDYKKQDICFLLAMAGIFLLHLYKSRIGLGSSDEQFYTTLGYRLFQGDALFYDDWHIAQMISVFIAPFVTAFIKLTGSTAGILLYMRIVYALFSTLCGVAFYLHFRSKGWGAVIGSCTFMLFTPYSIMALSYNTMSTGFLLLAMAVYPWKEYSGIQLFLSGILYAWSVINTPYLALIFVFLTIVTLAKKDKFSHRRWLSMFAGIACAAIMFFCIVFSRESLGQMLEGLPHLIDPSHSDSIPLLFAKNGARLILLFKAFMAAFLLEFVLSLRWRKDKEKSGKLLDISIIINLCAALYVCLLVRYKDNLGGYSVLLIPLTLCGLIALKDFSSESKAWFILSVFHAWMISISSNVGPSAFSGPLITACAVFMMETFPSASRLSKTALTGFLTMLLFFRITSVYLPSFSYDVKVEDGPLAGLYTSETEAENYYKTLDDLNYINSLEGKNAMLVTWNSWEYLALNKKIATNSTYIYFWERDEYINAQKEYESMHPDKFPMYVYLDQTASPYSISEEDEWIKGFTKLCQLKNGALFLREN